MFGDSPVHGSFKKKAKSSYRVTLAIGSVNTLLIVNFLKLMSSGRWFTPLRNHLIKPQGLESLLSAWGRVKQQMKLETKFSFYLIQPEGHVLNQTVRVVSVYISEWNEVFFGTFGREASIHLSSWGPQWHHDELPAALPTWCRWSSSCWPVSRLTCSPDAFIGHVSIEATAYSVSLN